MDQLKIIPIILNLCKERKYSEAIDLTNLIEAKSIAIKAHMLVMEHEARYLKETGKTI